MTIQATTITDAQTASKNETRSRIPFPQAGEGAFFFFPLSSLVKLEEAMQNIMPGAFERGFTSFGLAEKLLLEGHPKAVQAAIDCGLKKLDETGKPVPFEEIDLDEIDWPINEIVEPVLSALSFSCFNKSYSDMLAEAIAAAKERAAEARKIAEDQKAFGGS